MYNTVRKLAWEKLQKKFVMNGNTMIENRTGEVLGPEVDSTYWKDKFQADFVVYKDYKIICHMVAEIHILNGIDTLGT